MTLIFEKNGIVIYREDIQMGRINNYRYLNSLLSFVDDKYW